MRLRHYLTLGAALASITVPARVRAQGTEERPWSNEADLSILFSRGNNDATNISVSDKFVYRWPRSEWMFTGSALRSQTVERGKPELAADGTVRVPEVEATTAAYGLAGKYSYTVRDDFLIYTSGGWERDRRSGIEDRFSGSVGIGYQILAAERQKLVAELGVDYTDELRVDDTRESHPGGRSTLSYERKLTDTSKLNADLELLENLQDTRDLRANTVAGVTASLTEALALKLSYTIKYDNEPVEILVAPGESDAIFRFHKTDSRLGASLVVNF